MGRGIEKYRIPIIVTAFSKGSKMERDRARKREQEGVSEKEKESAQRSDDRQEKERMKK